MFPRQIAILSMLAMPVMAFATPAKALTTPQSTMIAAKAKADALARFRAQALIKGKADAVVRARADAVEKAKIKVVTAFSIHAEVAARQEAAAKAAQANAQITSVRLSMLTSNHLDPAVVKVHPDAGLMHHVELVPGRHEHHDGQAHHDHVHGAGEHVASAHAH
jgi:hypothetical protein